MCEGAECKCNLPAKITCCVGFVVLLVGSILYAVGAIQAANLAAMSMIVDGQRSFTLQLEDSAYLSGYSFFSLPSTSCDDHSGQVESQLDSSMGQFVSTCGWRRGRLTHNGRDLVSIGALSPYDSNGLFTGGSVSFSLGYRTWVLDASVDPGEIHDAFALVGLTFVGFIISAIGSIACCAACCLMCCHPDNKTSTPVQQVQIPAGTTMVVGQPVTAQPVMAQPCAA
mmetsp:Transcript_8210/g.10200  ORF Transcript_8210/g.10200 Transcript_8210/m.10200 type:complete len:226 (+) Transcript_8210:60-737(+)